MAPAQRWDADEAVTQLYAAHYTGLVRLAALLVRNSGEAEEIVQDAFVAMHGRWRRLREPDKALGYLRRSVVNASPLDASGITRWPTGTCSADRRCTRDRAERRARTRSTPRRAQP